MRRSNELSRRHSLNGSIENSIGIQIKYEQEISHIPNIEVAWDWCSEATPEDGEWLAQLVMLFRYGALRTLRQDRNNLGNDDGFITQPYLYFDKPQLEDIADNLMVDSWFLSMANHDLKLIKDEKLKKDLETYVPDRLWNKIVNYK